LELFRLVPVPYVLLAIAVSSRQME
jgi:hypothetical protein